MAPTLRCFFLTTASLVLALLTACGGGSSASFSSKFSTSLYLDGAAGIDAEVIGRLASVRLEGIGGEAGSELLVTETEVALARMDGTGSLVALRGVEAGTYGALVLRFADASLRARFADARESALAPSSHLLRVPFAMPWPARSADTALAVRHREPSPLAGGTVVDWSPMVDVAPIDVVPLRFARVDVLRVDHAAQSAVGLLVSLDARQVTLTFADDALLLREPSSTPLDRSTFLAGLESGAELVVDGLLDHDDRVTVTAAIDRGVAQTHGRGEKGELRARIAEIVTGREAFRAVVLDVEKGAHLLPDPRPRTVVVDASQARIRWSPRRGRHGGHLPFGALEIGMIVEIEWHGATNGDPLPADKIEIREQGTCLGRDFAGEVIGVAFEPRTLALRLREPVVIDGRELREIEFALGEDTPIVRTDGSAVRLVRLAEVELGERAHVLADPRGRGRLRAELVVLGWR